MQPMRTPDTFGQSAPGLDLRNFLDVTTRRETMAARSSTLGNILSLHRSNLHARSVPPIGPGNILSHRGVSDAAGSRASQRRVREARRAEGPARLHLRSQFPRLR